MTNMLTTIGTLMVLISVSLAYEWDVRWLDGVKLDHFAFANQKTFKLKYLVNDSYFEENIDGHPGAIYFYCGNEGAIEMFADNSGLVWDLAKQDKAMVVFAEHRFYGDTLPFGNESYSNLENLGFLTVDQAMADFATLINHMKTSDPKLADSPVIAFGGSYGGMLAAWMRIKYPTVILGSLASSAPILQFTGYTPCNTYYDTVTYAFKDAIPDSPEVVKKVWPALRRMAASDVGRHSINSIMNLCPNSVLNKTADVDGLVYWLVDSIGSLAMINYPYPTNFLEPVPGWPVKEAGKCFTFSGWQNASDVELVKAMHCGIGVYANYTGQTKCYDLASDSTPDLGDSGWDFQACTTMVMPICQSAESMFEVLEWNLTSFTADCSKNYWGVNTDPYWAMLTYGGSDLSNVDNIIFSNGKLDPWSGGGVNPSTKPQPPAGITVMWLEYGAHHYDLRGENDEDTYEVRNIRYNERMVINTWIRFYRKRREQLNFSANL